MKNTTSSVADILTNTKQVTNYSNNSNNINNNYSSTDFSLVNNLLLKHQDLIVEQYRGWFARAFHKLGEGAVANCAELARTGNNPKNYFGWLINRKLTCA